MKTNTSFPIGHSPALPGSEELLTKSQIAVKLQVTQRTVDNFMARGILPYFKLGNRMVRFRLLDVQAHLDRTCRVAR
jgi:predicted DNA-binding transcriptional regulator AlpA